MDQNLDTTRARAVPLNRKCRLCLVRWPDGSTERVRYCADMGRTHALVERDDVYLDHDEDAVIEVRTDWLDWSLTEALPPTPFQEPKS